MYYIPFCFGFHLAFSLICHCISTYVRPQDPEKHQQQSQKHILSRLAALLPLYNYVLSLPFFGLLLKIIVMYLLYSSLHSWPMNGSKSPFLYKNLLKGVTDKKVLEFYIRVNFFVLSENLNFFVWLLINILTKQLLFLSSSILNDFLMPNVKDVFLESKSFHLCLVD